MEENSPYDRPDLYDLLAPADPVLERFYVGEALVRSGPVLDLACGTGRLTIPLARAGKQVVGADLSAEMLQRARSSASAQGLELDLRRIDMRDFDLEGRKFDLIIVATNSLLHLQDYLEFRGFFRSVARHLTAGGRLIFDVFVPSMQMLSRDPIERHLVGSVTHPQLGDVSLEETLRYDPIGQVSHITWYWSTREQRDFWVTPLRMRAIFPQELPLLIEAGGLRLLERHGDFNRSAFGPESFRQVCECALA
jgi:SAM-dependent methyltransferase